MVRAICPIAWHMSLTAATCCGVTAVLGVLCRRGIASRTRFFVFCLFCGAANLWVYSAQEASNWSFGCLWRADVLAQDGLLGAFVFGIVVVVAIRVARTERWGQLLLWVVLLVGLPLPVHLLVFRLVQLCCVS